MVARSRVWIVVFLVFSGFVYMPAKGQYIVGHRGASHVAPENTMAAFELAWREGADGVEGDFRLTADGHVVCIHDADTKRTTGRELVVAESTLAQLQELDAGSWKDPKYAGERMPALEQVVDSLPDEKLLFIELKTGPEIVPAVQQVLSADGVPVDRLVVIAFDRDVIRACKRAMPKLKAHWLVRYERSKTGAWTPDSRELVSTLQAISADGLGSQANRSAFDEAVTSALRDAKLSEFHVWTVDDPELARFYIDQGVWSLTTNRPGWLREKLGKSLR